MTSGNPPPAHWVIRPPPGLTGRASRRNINLPAPTLNPNTTIEGEDIYWTAATLQDRKIFGFPDVEGVITQHEPEEGADRGLRTAWYPWNSTTSDEEARQERSNCTQAVKTWWPKSIFALGGSHEATAALIMYQPFPLASTDGDYSSGRHSSSSMGGTVHITVQWYRLTDETPNEGYVCLGLSHVVMS